MAKCGTHGLEEYKEYEEQTRCI